MDIKIQIIILVIIIIALLSLGNMNSQKKGRFKICIVLDYSGLHYACA